MSPQTIDLDLDYLPHLPSRIDYGIGCLGAGFIMRDVHLVAYKNAGFKVVAISDISAESARKAAELRGIPRVHHSLEALLADPQVQILDIAIPPDKQLEVIAEAVRRPHILGILAQKPLAMNLKEARQIVELCAKAGKNSKRTRIGIRYSSMAGVYRQRMREASRCTR